MVSYPIVAAAELFAVLALATPVPSPRSSFPPSSERIVPNDNRRPAGRLENGVLTVRLEARDGQWYPEGVDGQHLSTAAFAEDGKPLEDPGPLLRAPAGTEMRVTVHNALAKPLTIFGMGARRGLAGEHVVIPPGRTREMRFRVTEPGSYYYAGKTIPDSMPIAARHDEDSQLNGAIVVDPPGTKGPPADRVFIISGWAVLDSTSPTGLGRAVLAINGLSWPHTERLDLIQGDSVHWRWINLTGLDHPMHLHGFYFRMDAKGDGITNGDIAPDQRRMEVTEILSPGQTMALSWLPDRPGNWIFHCHFAGHVSYLVALDTHGGMAPTMDMLAHHASDAPHQMYGLVLGIRVAPRPGLVRAVSAVAPRQIRLLMRSRPNVYGQNPGFAFVLGGSRAAADPTALTVPGPLLLLEKDQPVAITLVNQSNVPEAVHWHGIEVDQSYPDGVPQWSGWEQHILPSIPPGDSLTVRFTPPRAGTFMYHSHFNEFHQITSGLYGPIIVLEKGAQYDPNTDRVLVFSDGGPTTNVITGPFPPTLLNGKAHPAPMALRAGTTYRLRLINIKGDTPEDITLLDGGQPAEWRLVAKDGMTVPRGQATMRPATLHFAPGEIYDFEFTPTRAGTLTLRMETRPQDPAVRSWPVTNVKVRVN
ncbi:MAG TPA: multicopper oxidase domain-containing protein [Gemmatimonadaceae bacterium]